MTESKTNPTSPLPRSIKFYEPLASTSLNAAHALEFVEVSRRFTSEIVLHVQGNTYCAQHVMDVLLADVDPYTPFGLTARGLDAEAAMDALDALLDQFVKRAAEKPKEVAEATPPPGSEFA